METKCPLVITLARAAWRLHWLTNWLETCPAKQGRGFWAVWVLGIWAVFPARERGVTKLHPARVKSVNKEINWVCEKGPPRKGLDVFPFGSFKCPGD